VEGKREGMVVFLSYTCSLTNAQRGKGPEKGEGKPFSGGSFTSWETEREKAKGKKNADDYILCSCDCPKEKEWEKRGKEFSYSSFPCWVMGKNEEGGEGKKGKGS